MKPELFANDTVGVITVKDIVLELEKPGRDPRPDFKVAKLQDGVEELKDLKVGMLLEGTISNVAAFGAFVDLGVHQDGLIHVSQLSHKFITDAREVVKTGDIVKVKVLEVDVARKRISLSMKLDATPARPEGTQAARHDNRYEHAGRDQRQRAGGSFSSGNNAPPPAAAGSAMASAFAKLQGLKK